MKIEAAEVAGLREQILKEVPSMGSVAKHLVEIVGRVIDEAGRYQNGIEARIGESGSVPGDVVTTLMLQGALSEIIDGLPDGNVRRDLVAAGRLVGKFMATKYGEKIRDTMAKKMGGN
jgi:hypothetical protein